LKELENDPENPCFGCGPNNQIGLRLKFYKDSSRVIARTTFDERRSAWPGQVHGGVVFTALECTCQWTFQTLKHRSGPTEKWKMEFVDRVEVGEPVTLVGRVTKVSPGMVRVRADILQRMKARAFMVQDIRVVRDLKEFRKLRPAVEIDRVMMRNFERR